MGGLGEGGPPSVPSELWDQGDNRPTRFQLEDMQNFHLLKAFNYYQSPKFSDLPTGPFGWADGSTLKARWIIIGTVGILPNQSFVEKGFLFCNSLVPFLWHLLL